MTLTADNFQPRIDLRTDAWLEAAFDRHWGRVVGVLYRIVGDQAEAEDLALESFWRLHNRRSSLEDERRISGWLYRVAVNLGFNALRAYKRRQRYELQAGKSVLENASTSDPAEQVEKNLEQQRVRTALARMRPRSAQLLILRHSGLTYAEAAEALSLSPGSIGTLLARAEREFEACYQTLE
ncbi:MAG: sigma-70 family RNA polymerase sigma factor [Anaerolineales bacterium]